MREVILSSLPPPNGHYSHAVIFNTSPAEIGLESGQYVHGVAAAQLIRKRYTILDLVYELGLSKALLAAL